MRKRNQTSDKCKMNMSRVLCYVHPSMIQWNALKLHLLHLPERSRSRSQMLSTCTLFRGILQMVGACLLSILYNQHQFGSYGKMNIIAFISHLENIHPSVICLKVINLWLSLTLTETLGVRDLCKNIRFEDKKTSYISSVANHVSNYCTHFLYK